MHCNVVSANKSTSKASRSSRFNALLNPVLYLRGHPHEMGTCRHYGHGCRHSLNSSNPVLHLQGRPHQQARTDAEREWDKLMRHYKLPVEKKAVTKKKSALSVTYSAWKTTLALGWYPAIPFLPEVR
jgi:hypothetical protein